MKKLLTSTFLFFFFHLLVVAQESGVPDISVKFEKDTYLFLEPWKFTIEVKNTDTVDVKFRPTRVIGGRASRGSLIKMEFNNNSTWVETESISNICDYENPTLYDLKPGESYSYQFVCAPPFRLLKEGTNEIRVLYNNFCRNDSEGNIYSIPVKITVVNYLKEDLDAYKYLLSLPKPECILFPVVSIAVDTSIIDDISRLLLDFPESTFACNARGILSILYANKADRISRLPHIKDKPAAFKYLRESKKFGLETLNCKDSALKEKVISKLRDHINILLYLYDFDIAPPEIENEFYYPYLYRQK